MDITEQTQEEKDAGIRTQVKARVRQIQQTKDNVPKAVEQLKTTIAGDSVKAAFGDNYVELKKLVDSL